MKLSTVFVEGMYSNIRRGAIQIYIPLRKYVLQETLVTANFFVWAPNTIIIAKKKKTAMLQTARLFNKTSYPDS